MTDDDRALAAVAPQPGTALALRGVLDIEGVQGAKGKGGGRQPREAPDTLRSTQIAEIVDLLGEGEIGGLVNGLKSVYLDDVPIENADGTRNFELGAFTLLLGAPGQTALPGFDTVQSEVAVGVNVLAATPVVRTVNNAAVDTLRVTISVPTLSELNTGNGDLNGSSFEWAIEVQSNGGGFVERYRATITGKTTSGYNKSIKLPLASFGPAPWDVRVRRVSADAPTANITNLFTWQSYTEIQSVRLRYTNSAVAGMRLDAKAFANVPRRAFDVFGIVDWEIPVNYDPLARTTSGVWNGTFKLGWTSNPAWVLYNLIKKKRYGLGEYVSVAPDKWTLYQLAAWCDVMLSDGRGGTEPRYQINAYIQTAREALVLLQEIASIFRGVIVYGAGSIGATWDQPGAPVATYSAANVIDGTFNYADQSEKQVKTVCTCYYADQAQLGKRNSITYEDAALIAKYGIREMEIEPLGCTSPGQAMRLAKWAIYSLANEQDTVAFRVGSDGVVGEVGKVFQVADASESGERLAGRIVAATASAVTLDSEVTLDAGETYTLWAGQPDPANPTKLLLEERPVTNAAGTYSVLNVFPAFSAAPAVETMWLLSGSNVQPTLWRYVSVSEQVGEKGKVEYEIVGVQHHPGKWSAIEQGIVVTPRPTRRLGTAPAKPGALVFAETTYRVGDVTRSRVTVSWPATVQGLLYTLAWRLNNGMWTVLAPSGTNSVEIDGLATGTLDVDVRSVNAIGQPSLPTTATFSVVGAGSLAAAIGGKNLLSNSGLSQDANANGVADGWAVYNNAAVSATLEMVAGRRTGFNAQRVTFNAASTSTHGVRTGSGFSEGGVTGGVLGGWRANENYVLSFYARKVNGAGFVGCDLLWNTPPASVVALANPPLSAEFQRYAFKLRWGAAVEAGGQLYIQRLGVSVAGDAIEICDVQVEEGELLTAYAPRTDELLKTVLVDGVSLGAIATATTNFNAGNDRNASAVPAPTLFTDGSTIDHTLQADGSADISFEWLYASPEGEIDGFIVTVYQSAAGTAYTMGTSPAAETAYVLPASKRAFVLFGTAANAWYTFGVRAYRKVDADVAAQGVIQSAIAQSAVSGENPYRPSASVAFAGDVTGTVNGIAAANVNVWSAIGGSGKPEDNATLGASAGSNLKDSTGRVTADYRLLGNLLDAGTWVLGSSGSQPYFTAIGNASEDQIVFDLAPDNTYRILWRATSADVATGGSTDPDGGWDSGVFNIDHLKQYRFSVWFKPSGVMDGSAYLGCSAVNDVGGGLNANPYFLVQPRAGMVAGRWYLMVGFVLPSTYAGAQLSIGGVYDGVTGEKVANGTDFRWTSGQATSFHRAYLFYAGSGAMQDFFDPRVEVCNGAEPSINELLKVIGTLRLGLGSATQLPAPLAVASVTVTGRAATGTQTLPAPNASNTRWTGVGGLTFTAAATSDDCIVTLSASAKIVGSADEVRFVIDWNNDSIATNPDDFVASVEGLGDVTVPVFFSVRRSVVAGVTYTWNLFAQGLQVGNTVTLANVLFRAEIIKR